MKLVTNENKTSLKELKELSSQMFGNLVKAVVDVDKKIMVIQAELHADEEAILMQIGSLQKNLWGINLYPDLNGKDFIEFDSMINLRPSQGNTSRGVDDEKVQKETRKIVAELLEI